MSLICVQCALKSLLEHQTPTPFDETPEEHLARVHPNPEVTRLEREQLNEAFRAVIANELHSAPEDMEES
jgi:hypothetical protein